MDVDWLSHVFDRVFKGKPYEEVATSLLMPCQGLTVVTQLTMKDYMEAMKGLKQSVGTDVSKWTFGGLQRGTADGKFKDSDLAKLIFDAYAFYRASPSGRLNDCFF